MYQELDIIVSVYNRPNYTRRSLKSLIASTNNSVVLIDDCSKELNWKRTLSIIKDQKNIKPIRMNRNWGIDKLVYNYPSLTSAKYIYITDNDMIYSRNFEKSLYTLLNIIKENKKLIGTMFNSHFHYVDRPFDKDHIIKKSIGGQSVLIEKESFVKMLEFLEKVEENSPSWDWALQQFAIKYGYEFISTKNSYVETIGTWGLHAKPPYVVDFAENFKE